MADDVSKDLIKNYAKNIGVWGIKDVSEEKRKDIEKLIEKIIEKVDKLNRKLNKTKPNRK